jgi:D-sedoheptulose 7-phosphate isomerase
LETYWVDIDKTIFRTIGTDYEHSIPISEAIEEVNRLYDEGNTIVIWTGRGSRSGKGCFDLTKRQLYSNGVKYSELRFDKKPDVIIDDIAVSMEDWLFKKDNKVRLLAGVISDACKYKSKVLVAGNGGLCAEASHFAAELVGKYAFDLYIPCVSLGDCAPLVTAIANDFTYNDIFSHQVNVLGNLNDVFIGMTTSRSPNIVKALEAARKKGLITVVICSTKYTEFIADYVFPMCGNDTAEVQENTLKFLHRVAYKSKEMLVK